MPGQTQLLGLVSWIIAEVTVLTLLRMYLKEQRG